MGERCTFKDDDDCSFSFSYKENPGKDVIISVQREKGIMHCPCYEFSDCIVLYCIVLYCIVLYCVVLCCVVLCCVVLCCVVLYCIVLYCIVLYCNYLPHINYTITITKRYKNVESNGEEA